MAGRKSREYQVNSSGFPAVSCFGDTVTSSRRKVRLVYSKRMPLFHTADATAGCVFVYLHGVVTGADLLAAQEAMYRDPLFRPEYPRLVEAADDTDLQASVEMIRGLATTTMNRGTRRVALVASSDLVYAMMRIFEVYASPADCCVFRRREDALQWLFPANRHRVPG